MINKKMKQENAITIVALVITIVIILILAGIGLSMLTGQGGLLERVQMASLNTKTQEVKERVQLKLTNLNIEKMAEDQKEATLNDVLKMEEHDEEITNAYEEDNNVILVVDKYECKINDKMQVESVSVYNPAQLRKVQRSLTHCSFEEKNMAN